MIAGLAGVYLAVGTMLMPVLVCIAVGIGWGHRKLAYPGMFVSTLVTMVATPALVFHTLATTRLAPGTVVSVALAAVLGIALMGVLSAIVLRIAGFPVRTLVPTATFPNAGNLGLPLSQLAFGDAGLSVAVAFFSVTSFLQHTVGVSLLTANKGGKAGKPGLISPVVLAAVSAVILRVADLPVPGWIVESTRMLGSLTIPLMLISLGYTLVTISFSSIREGFMLGMIRLGVGVVGGTAVVKLLGLPPEVAGVTLFQMMMPVAVINYMYAQRYTDHADATAGSVVASTACFLVLCPLALWYAGAPLQF
ncbi:AEC family transporter [Lacisediminimonas profundi]|uniref:AEC family transporter n=1 Tax=Lacisediminimonas profundi TaxID=2603856 RepID=UPI00124BA89A|nr:AEC family transporter [Lacisediminimonas profundi]